VGGLPDDALLDLRSMRFRGSDGGGIELLQHFRRPRQADRSGVEGSGHLVVALLGPAGFGEGTGQILRRLVLGDEERPVSAVVLLGDLDALLALVGAQGCREQQGCCE
jgi:hypothetical protein